MFGLGICLLGIGTLIRRWYKKRKRKLKQKENVSSN